MRIPTPVQALSAAAALALLAGCSSSAVAPSGTSNLGSISRESGVKHYVAVSAIPKGFLGVRSSHGLNFVAPDAVPGGLYASEFSGSAINHYKIPNKLNGPPTCTDGPASAPNGINVDKHRNLWDPDGGTRTIIEFAPNCGGQLTSVASNGGNQPADVAFDGTKMYVADVNLDGIDVYTAGVYTTTLTNPGMSGGSCFGVATIGHNVFASSTSNVIVEYANGAEPGVDLTTSGMTGTTTPGGMTGDSHKNLIVVDLSNGILSYAPPYTQAPAKVTAPVGSSVYAHLDKTNEFLYVGDYGNGAIDVYTYPGMKYKYSVTNGLSVSFIVEGVAVDFIGKN
jgi:hypothetical protein